MSVDVENLPQKARRVHGRSGSDAKAAPTRVWPALPSKVVKSAGRTLQVLEYFDTYRCSANVVEVARALCFPQSSTSILLRSLVQMGYLEYEPTLRVYRPTARVALLGNWIEPALSGNGVVLDLMRDVSARSTCAVALAARNGLQTQLIHVVVPKGLDAGLAIGSTDSLVGSAAGLIFLSGLPDVEISRLVRRVNAYAAADETPLRPAEFQKVIEDVRRTGYALQSPTIDPSRMTLAIALPSSVTRRPLAMSVTGERGRLLERKDDIIATAREGFRMHFSGESGFGELSHRVA